MASTQEHISIQNVRDDVAILRDGSMAIVLETSAVNFGLLSENEQLAIISSFAGMLNSLSFAIQIVIRSKRLDISGYLQSLDDAQLRQRNPLLSKMIGHYRSFIKETVRENEVLDKQFFIVIPLSFLEIGLGKNSEESFKKAMTILLPRRDHIMRQLARCGLRSDQLPNEAIVELFYDIYNPSIEVLPVKEEGVQASEQAPAPIQSGPAAAQQQPPVPPSKPQAPAPQPLQPLAPPAATSPTQAVQPQPATSQPASSAPRPAPQPTRQPLAQPTTPSQTMQKPQPHSRRTGPFVVEELPDDYGTL